MMDLQPQIKCPRGHDAQAESCPEVMPGVLTGAYSCEQCQWFRCAKCKHWVSWMDGSSSDLGLCSACGFDAAPDERGCWCGADVSNRFPDVRVCVRHIDHRPY